MTLNEITRKIYMGSLNSTEGAKAILEWHKKEMIRELEAVAEDYRILRKRIAELKEG